jgi:hypothetical protein
MCGDGGDGCVKDAAAAIAAGSPHRYSPPGQWLFEASSLGCSVAQADQDADLVAAQHPRDGVAADRRSLDPVQPGDLRHGGSIGMSRHLRHGNG